MSLSPGTRLGPYEVVSPLGAGGMGEVYRAVDARLGRRVAIKVLPPGYTADADRLKRFEREARAASALNHPSIVTIHDVGTVDSTSYIAMELVEGKTLREVITGGALAARRALEIAAQIASGLAAAHEAAIVHRDLKPENIMLRGDGIAKILDFGLAKLTYPESGSEVTSMQTVSAATDAGVVMGTVGYMSPEQASGERTDFRTDQFALGAILYELLTGRRAFLRATAPETLAAIIREEPEPIASANPQVPAPLRWITERCLSKEPARRYASTADLAGDLKTLSERLPEVTGTGGIAGGVRARPRPLRLALAGVALALLAAAGPTALLIRERRRPAQAPVRFEVRLPEGHFLDPYRNSIALSPDGRLLAFLARAWKTPYQDWDESRIFLRPLDSVESRPIPGTEGGLQPIFSPDGGHLAFIVWSEGKLHLKRVPVAGGPVATVCACDASFGAVWSPDGSILFASKTGPLQRLPAAGGTPEPVTTLDAAAGEVSHRLPHLMPDGRTVLYTALRWTTMAMTWEKVRIYAERPGTKERALLVEGGSDGRWVPPGALLFAREGKLFAAPVDSRSLRRTGEPTLELDGVRHAVWTSNSGSESGSAQVAVSANGIFAWGPGSVDPPWDLRIVWLDAHGKERPVEPLGKAEPYLAGRISVDGQRILLSYNYPGRQSEVVDVSRRAVRRATFGANPHWAIWGPGPGQITFTSKHEGPTGIYARRLDAGPDEMEMLWKPTDGSSLAVGSWSRDGKLLAFVKMVAASADIWLLEAGKAPRPFVASGYRETHPDISPDGRWLLYTSDESGRAEVFVRSLSGEGGAQQISAGGGDEALWSRDGSAVHYWQWVEGKPGVRALFRVRVTESPQGLEFGNPERLFEKPHLDWSAPAHGWDMAPDGRFLVRVGDEAQDRATWDKLLTNRIVVDTSGER